MWRVAALRYVLGVHYSVEVLLKFVSELLRSIKNEAKKK
ncbi:hypothetical protein T4B_9223 [Trichinella pseudospiralis]|uniref:Uncharacterized protein n=1 Tax=Trichinella pseudospiralis TaxID=6337 RepID=A0A0V1GGN1_TRIPS|nr:hypothetical protein T4B_9223 [Trichinella pseudospiralis]